MSALRLAAIPALGLAVASPSAATTLAGFNAYPAYDRPGSRIEAVIDRGPIAELIVRCPRGTAILSYSKVERLYCDPRGRCSRDRDTIIARSC